MQQQHHGVDEPCQAPAAPQGFALCEMQPTTWCPALRLMVHHLCWWCGVMQDQADQPACCAWHWLAGHCSGRSLCWLPGVVLALTSAVLLKHKVLPAVHRAPHITLLIGSVKCTIHHHLCNTLIPSMHCAAMRCPPDLWLLVSKLAGSVVGWCWVTANPIINRLSCGLYLQPTAMWHSSPRTWAAVPGCLLQSDLYGSITVHQACCCSSTGAARRLPAAL